MQEVTFDVETITPLFLAGADQGMAELRAPSFRGLMRYWLRAVVGGSENLKDVAEVERAVFGATDQGSPVRIKLQEISQRSELFNVTRDGTGYLLWSMNESREGEQYKPHRFYFLPHETTFRIILSASDTNIVALKRAVASFWLLTHLGGIGSRSRRCAGSMAITNVDNNPTPLTFGEQSTPLSLKIHLEENLKNIRELYGLPKRPYRESASFDVLAQNVSRIRILQGARPWYKVDDAMRAIGRGLQESRKIRSTPSGRKVIPKEERQIFGLPLEGVNEKDRRASPLLLQVTKLQREYVGIAVLFKTQGRDYTLIDNFLDNSTHFRNAQEVML